MEVLKQEFGVGYYDSWDEWGACVESEERLKKRLTKLEANEELGFAERYVVELYDIHDEYAWYIPKDYWFDSYEEGLRFYLDH